MPRAQDEEMRRRKRRRVARETRPREGEDKGRRTKIPPSNEASPPPPTPSKEQPATASASASGEDQHALREEEKEKGRRTKTPPFSEASPPPPKEQPASASASASGEDQQALLALNVRRMLAIRAERRARIAEQIRMQSEGPILTVESTFCDIDDGSTESHEARKVALRVAQSIVSLSSFAGRKRIRVCSGFVIRWNESTGTGSILTSAALVRPPHGDNYMVPGVRVEVLLPSGDISDGQISLVDFHHNIGLVEVTCNLKLREVVILEDVIDRGDVLALGRAYEGGLLMCSRGQINNRANIFKCSDLLVSSCKITMAGTGGPLVSYNGHVLGLNFYEENQTPFLSMAIISRCLEHYQSFGRIIRPWLGFLYTSIQMVPLSDLEQIYQTFPDVDDGLYISDVAEGSPADVAGLCEGDILIKCGGKVLSTAPVFGAMLLDICKEHMEAYYRETNRDCPREKITVEVLIKQQRDGSTISKTISADLIEESNYNRWPTPIPSYKVKRDSIGWR